MALQPPPPTRRSSSGTLSFGIISIPIDVFTAEVADVGKVKRSLRSNNTGNPIGYKMVDKVTGDEVERAGQYKAFVFEDEQEVSLSDEEILSVLSPVKGAAIIVAFIPESVAGELLPVKHFQVRPHKSSDSKAVVDPGVAKAWSLLTGAMEARTSVAVVRLAMRDRDAFYTLFSDGRMAEVLPAQAVREQRPMVSASTAQVEQDLALQLLDAAWQDHVPELSNDGAARVEVFAADKLAGVGPARPMATPSPKTVDLIDQLTKSIEAKQQEKADAQTPI